MSILNNRNRSEYAFPLATQSNEIQLKYYEQHGLTLSAPEKTALQKVKPSPVQRPLDSYTDADREKIGFWQDVVDQWMLYRSQTGKPLSELDHKFVQHMRVENPGVELSVPTLYRKKKALDEGDLDGVIDRRGKRTNCAPHAGKHRSMPWKLPATAAQKRIGLRARTRSWHLANHRRWKQRKSTKKRRRKFWLAPRSC